MRRAPLTLIVIAAAALAAAAATGAATDAGNRAAAKRDAAAHVRALRLPAGAERVAAGKPSMIEGDLAHALAAGRWRVPQSTMQSVVAYIRAHPPTGARLTGTGSAGTAGGGITEEDLQYTWPAVAGRLGSRTLWVSATSFSGGAARVSAVAQSDWVVLRPRSERVPAGVERITITSGVPGKPPEHSLTVTSRREIDRVEALVDALPASQPVVINCPSETDPRRIAVAFQPGATLTITAFRPWTAAAGPCGAFVTFRIHGRRQPGLDAGHFVRDLQRVLGAKLVP